jgi:hypothetical protein
MKKYILKSAKIEGDIIFGYDLQGYLVFFEMPENLSEEHARGMLKALPKTEQHLTQLVTGKDVSITEVPEDLSFERFWNAYDKKINRKRAEPLFEKLNTATKMQPIINIKAYQEYCHWKRRGVADPEKYLRDGFFETDWTKIK